RVWAKPTLHNGIGPYWTSNIFQALLAQIGELNRDLATDLIVGGKRDANAARFRDALKPRGYIHAVPKTSRGSTITSPILMPTRKRMRLSSISPTVSSWMRV